MKTNKNKTNGKQVNNKIINTTKIKNFRGRGNHRFPRHKKPNVFSCSNKFEQIKNKIYGVNKILAILGFLIVAGALLTIAGNVVVKDGQLNVSNNLFVDSNCNGGIGTISPVKC